MAREVIETTDEVVFEDLLKIATLHYATINEKVREANRILVCDTDVNITKSYSKYLFGRELVVPDWIEAANQFDLHIFPGYRLSACAGWDALTGVRKKCAEPIS